MPASSSPSSLVASPAVAELLLASARTLQKADPSEVQTVLRGKRLALLCDSDRSVEAVLFCRAAEALGANVAHVRPGLTELSPKAALKDTARVLGRLYDGIECQGLSQGLIEQVRREAGIPVFDGVACAGHTSALLADLLEGDDTPERKRQWILEAVLMRALR